MSLRIYFLPVGSHSLTCNQLLQVTAAKTLSWVEEAWQILLDRCEA